MSDLASLPFARPNVETRPLTYFQTGGTAAWMVEVRSQDELQAALRAIRASGLPWTLLGAGSNTVFPPRYEGVLLRVAADGISFHGAEAVVEANVRWMPLLREAAKRGLGGMESFSGLPGTVGGAVRGNAGCYGLETRDVLIEATIVDFEGNAAIRDVAWFEFGYRMSRLKKQPDGIIWNALLRFTPQDEAAVTEKMRAISSLRSAQQPAGKSTGSFFANPAENAAGALIDRAGLKGLRVGDAYVPEKHANFLMNAGNARPEDVASLVVQIQQKVMEVHGVHLEPEVVLIDRPWWAAMGVTFRDS